MSGFWERRGVGAEGGRDGGGEEGGMDGGGEEGRWGDGWMDGWRGGRRGGRGEKREGKRISIWIECGLGGYVWIGNMKHIISSSPLISSFSIHFNSFHLLRFPHCSFVFSFSLLLFFLNEKNVVFSSFFRVSRFAFRFVFLLGSFLGFIIH